MAYRKNEGLIGIVPRGHLLSYIIGIVSILIGMSVLIFTTYMIPYLFFDKSYSIPNFMIDFNFWLQSKGQKGNLYTLLVVSMPPILFSIGLFFLASMVTRELEKLTDKRLHDHEEDDSEKLLESATTNSEHLIGKVFLIFLVLIISMILLEIWILISL